MKTKKFEKLNLSKFDAFKQNELTFISSIAIEGGYTGTGAYSGMEDTDANGGGGSTANQSHVRNDGHK